MYLCHTVASKTIIYDTYLSAYLQIGYVLYITDTDMTLFVISINLCQGDTTS